MATTITPVTLNNIRHCLLIDLQIGGTTYYISNAYKSLTYNSNTYTELGAFLGVSQMSDDLKTTNGDINIALSGIPSNQNYISLMLSNPIKGGEVSVKRAFLNDQYQIDTVVERFKGVITNFTLGEDVELQEGEITKNISVSVASINTLLENLISGQRTNPVDRDKFYSGDGTFDRVPVLHNTKFDFGREYTGGTGYGGGGGGGGGGGPSRGPGRVPTRER